MRPGILEDGPCFRGHVQAPSGGILSETHVKRGRRVVHGDKELCEKLGRNDPCPCGSGLLFKKCCLKTGCFRRGGAGPLRAMSRVGQGPGAGTNQPGRHAHSPILPVGPSRRIV